jgi:hypothetical protein
VADITIKLDQPKTLECLRLMWQACGEPVRETISGDDALGELLRLSGIITTRYGFVPIATNEDWRTAGPAGTPRVSPTPNEALRKFCAALGAGSSSRTIGQIGIAHSS